MVTAPGSSGSSSSSEYTPFSPRPRLVADVEYFSWVKGAAREMVLDRRGGEPPPPPPLPLPLPTLLPRLMVALRRRGGGGPPELVRALDGDAG